MGDENRGPGYNPMMDDPDFRRGRKKTTTRTTEEVVEEEYADDEEYEYEEEGEEDMPNTPGVGAAIGGALAAGAKQAAAGQVNEMLAENITKMLCAAGILSEQAKNNVGVQMAIKGLAPVILLYIAERFPDQVPKSALVAEGAKLALTSATTEVIAPVMMMAGPMFKQLAGAAEGVNKELDKAPVAEKAEDHEIEITVTESS